MSERGPHDDRSLEPPFEHFLLTRFNVRMAMYEHPAPGWLSGRVDLFERFCLPSVAAQGNKDFRWLLFFDSHTPEAIRERVAALNAGQLFEVVDVEGVFTASSAADYIARSSAAPSVITTRLDNDDAIATDFVETVQAQFADQELAFINLVSGAQLWRKRVYRRPYTKNPFISLVERRTSEPPRTVFVTRHFAVDEVAPVANVRTTHPAWLQVIHSDNVLNEVVGLRTRGSTVLPWFGCAIDVDDHAVDYLRDRATGAVRVMVRLVRQPHRIVELGRTIVARRSARVSGGPPGS